MLKVGVIASVLAILGLLFYNHQSEANPYYASFDARYEGTASWFSLEACRVNPHPDCPTASQLSLYELEQAGIPFAAMWNVPFGSIWRVTNKANSRSVLVVILDRGPNKKLDRLIDLSHTAFKAIADPDSGVIQVSLNRLQ